MDTSYTYLNNDELHQVFDYCVSSQSNTNTNVYTVYLCIYNINTQCKVVSYDDSDKETETMMPFLKYIVRQVDTQYTFPSFQHTCSNDSDENETAILNASFLRILDILGLTIDSTMNAMDIKVAFKGFVSSSESCVFTVFDYAALMTYFTQTQTREIDISAYKWAIVDELVFEKRILGVQVDSIISTTFAKYPYLWNIKYKGRDIDFPFCLLNVKPYDGTYINETSPFSQSDTIFKHQSIVKIGESEDEYKYGNIYGDMHLFSASPVRESTTQEYIQLQRYAVFTIGCKYVVDDGFNAYMKTRNEMWNPLPTNTPIPPSHENVQDEDETKDEMEMENMMVSCIYFVEDKLFPTPVPLWGVRQPYRFEIL